MPYREAPTDAPCHQCERPAKNTCPCCERPSCERHLVANKQMCGKCDEAHYRFIHREDVNGIGRHLLLGAVIAAVPALITTAMIPFSAAAVFILGPGILWYRSRADRRKFLHMMRTRGALPEPKPAFTDEELALAKYQAKIDDRSAETRAPSDVDDSARG